MNKNTQEASIKPIFLNKSPLTLGQIDNVLSDIATNASQIRNMLCVLIAGGSDQISDESLLVAIECMVQRIGWAADMAMIRSERSIGPCIGSAADWMMPPVFNEVDKRRDQGSGDAHSFACGGAL